MGSHLSVLHPFYGWIILHCMDRPRRRQRCPLQSSCLEDPMDGGAWKAVVHGVAEGWTRLSDFTFTFTFHFHALEKEMATHSSVLAWRIPGTGEPAGLPSVGSHRVGHDWSDLAAAVSPDNSNAIGPRTTVWETAHWVYCQECQHFQSHLCHLVSLSLLRAPTVSLFLTVRTLCWTQGKRGVS